MTLWAIFLAIAVFFLLVLIIGVVFDGILDMFDVGGDGVLSMTSLGGAGTGFGVGGAIAISSFDVGVDGAVIAGVLGAALFGFASVKMARFVSSLDAQSLPQETKVGLVGYALMPAKPNDPFEFMITHDGQRNKISAISETAVKSGDALVVEAVLSSTRLKVRQQQPADVTNNGGEEVKQLTEAEAEGISAEDLTEISAEDLEEAILDDANKEKEQ